MADFLKCECWYCGQSIKFPSEAIGISACCPTCRKAVTLTLGSTANFGSILFPPSQEGEKFAKTRAEITLKINADDIHLHKTGKLEEKLKETSYVARTRREPATEKQKEKLLWFECTFDETITKGQAGDALDKCKRDFPVKERSYYDRPATQEQMKVLQRYYGKDLDDVEGPLTYGRAKDLISEIEMEKRLKEREYENSEEGRINEMTEFINGCGVNPRKITKTEITQAWKLAKSRNADKSYLPGDYAIVGALCELFPDLRSMRNDY